MIRNAIYYAGIDTFMDETIWAKAEEILCKERIEKINKCRQKEDKMRGLAAGLLLEYGLRQYGLSQKMVHFISYQNGKPGLLEEPGLHFNLTHSDRYAAAVFCDVEAGIDLEHFREQGEKIAARFFAEEEQTFLKEHMDASSFTRIWTRKESYVKATGEGIKTPFPSFSTVKDVVSQKEREELFYLKSYDCVPDCWLSVCTKGREIDFQVEKIDLMTFFC